MVGQHIRILKDGRWVHAVDCGDETVLLLAEEAPPPRVRRAYRPEFVAGAETVEVVTHRERTFPAREIVKRAYSRASDPALAAMFHDSESFVEWCTTGRLSAARNVALFVPAVAPAAARAAPRRDATPAPAARKASPAGSAKAKPAPRRAPARKAAPARRGAKAAQVKRGAKPAAAKHGTKATRSAKPAKKPAARRPAAKRASRSTKRR